VKRSSKTKNFLEANVQKIIKKFNKGTRNALIPSVTSQLLFFGHYLHDIVEPYFTDEFNTGYYVLANFKNDTVLFGEKRDELIRTWKQVSVSNMTGNMEIGGVEFGINFYYIDEDDVDEIDIDNTSYIKPNIRDYVSNDTMKVFGDLYDV
jgi:hypothetical protein